MPKTLDDATASLVQVHKVRGLLAAGQQDEAWETLQTHLNEHPDDIEARLLKAEMCLEIQRETGFVGQFLTEMQGKRGYRAQIAALLERAEKLAGEKLAEGRGRLERGYLRDAVGHFNAACGLLPVDPAVALSAALALLDDKEAHPSEALNLLDLFDSEKAPPSAMKMEEIEKYLNWTLERSVPGQYAYAEASRQLVRFWLAQNRVSSALSWLEYPANHSVIEADLSVLVYQHAVAGALNIAACLLRNEGMSKARSILRLCARAVPKAPLLQLLAAEVWLIIGDVDKAVTAYRKALRHGDCKLVIVNPEAARLAWGKAQNWELTCPKCGRAAKASVQTCSFCDAPIKRCDLFMDRFRATGASEHLLAHASLAYLLADQGQPDEALRHLDAALSILAAGGEAERVNILLRQKKLELESRVSSNGQGSWQLTNLLTQAPLTSETLSQIRRVCDTNSSFWRDLPLQARLALGRRLLRESHLSLARDFMATAFTDRANRRSVSRLADGLEQAILARVSHLLADARQALDAGRFEQALRLAGEALTLRPADDLAHLIRGAARLGMGHDLGALADFHSVMTHSADAAMIREARLASARTMAQRRDIDKALAVLRDLSGEEVEQVRARLERLKRGEPVVHIQASDSEVMYDTLARTSVFHGYFAMVIQSVGRPWNAALNEWTESILKAIYEFVQILGGLRHVVGTPIFALRIISQPHAHIPERGHLKLALVVRVSAESGVTCERRALDLWYTVRSLLPAQQNYVYHFEPVIDQEELSHLLVPFEPTGIAEIVRRETPAGRDGEHYTIYPFVPGTADLHNLCWMLLRQPAAAMVSVHLLPTELMAWERTGFDRIMQEEPIHENGRVQHADGLRLDDPVSQWWRGIPRWSQAHASRRLVDSMPSQAYLLTVNVASSALTDALLPEVVGSALFGSANPAADIRYGGYEVVRASSADEFQIARHNLAALDIERWVYTAAPDRLNRLRYLMSESEAVCAFRLPVPGKEGLPGVPLSDARPVPPPAGLPANGIVLGESVTSVAGMPLRITQGIEDRRRHTYVLGKTGVGKTTLLQALALQDIEAGYGVCVVDPHGDLIEELLLRIPAHRADDVILFDPSDDERPIGLNLLETASESEQSQIVNEFIGLLVRMYDPHQQGIVGPRFQHNVRNAMLTVMAVEGSTLIEVVRALTDSAFVRTTLPFVKDPLVRSYWEKQIASTSDYHKSEILDYIVSKFSRFVGDRRVRHIVGQRRTTLNFRQIMDRQQILLVNLSKGKIGSENAQFLGLLLVQQLLISALGRANLPTDQRRDFFLYVDEFQNFATDLFATMLSEGRKYGVAVVVANQYLTQLDHAIREAIFGNIGSMISFRLGTQDAAAMAPEMYPSFAPDDLLNLPKYTACVKLLVDGIASRPFTMRTLPDLRLPDAERAAAIRQTSRCTYGSDVTEIAGDIAARFKA